MKMLVSEIFEFVRNGFNAKHGINDGGIPITRIETISDSTINFAKVGYAGISITDAEKYILKDGDILFSHINSVSHIGKCAIYKKEFGNLVHGMNLLCFRPNPDKVDHNYALYLIRSNQFKDQLAKSIKKAVNQASVSTGDIKKIVLEVPPLAEQQRIAALLDTTAHVIRLREQAVVKLADLAQSKFNEIENNAIEYVELEKLLIKTKMEGGKESDKVWSLSLEQIEANTGKLIKKSFVDIEKLGASTFYFRPPVVLYSKLRPYLNKVYMPDESGYATTELIPLYCNESNVLPEYLASMLMSKKFVEYATVNSSGAKMPRIIMDKFWAYKMPIAKMDEQKRFSKIYGAIQKEKKMMEHELNKLQELSSSLQQQSFAVN